MPLVGWTGLAGVLRAPFGGFAYNLAALLTFLITTSDLVVLGVGSAFWGLLIGLVAYHLRMLGHRYLGPDTDTAAKA